MTLIQLFLLFFFFTAFLLYWKVFQNRFLNRLVLLVAFAGILFLVIKPEVSTTIANWLGVGRGTDLVLYLGIVVMIFVLLMMYSKIKKLEETITTIVRTNALKDTHDSKAE